MSASIRWHVSPDASGVVATVLAAIARHAERAIETRGAFQIVLSGGSTPRPVYERAALMDADWSHWHVFFTDERCVPANDPARNDRMAHDAWLGRVRIPPTQVHSIPAELGPEAGAAAYGETLREVGPFDLVLLGLGEDGHTASLFPGQPAGDTPGAPDALPVRTAPKPPFERVTLSAARLAHARAALVIACGSGKRAALRSLASGSSLPVRGAAPPSGLDVYADVVAAALTRGPSAHS